ncbi:MAG: class 1 fructose-bisphosphatase [Chloroflexi bacterium]|nr:class 1 fructose-bisphosphatase [Chloroflexota bacterium]
MSNPLITIERFLLSQQPENAKGDLTTLFYDIALAAKMIATQTRRSALLDILGYEGTTNVQGDRQRKLDVYADDVMFKLNDHTGRLCAMVSEERDDWIPIPEVYSKGHYILVYDPLDGSSNIDTNVTIGTIFGVFHTLDIDQRGRIEDCLRPGRELVAAGYIIYGTSTMFVYSAGQGVHGFTLDPEIGEFLLTHENMRFPEKPAYYSFNFGAALLWEKGMQKYAEWLQSAPEPRLSQRYIGSLVADFHRNLLYGGIYGYPGEVKYPNGKIRLLYEAGPLAFLAEHAGGYGSNGVTSLLDIKPDSLHQRTPVFIGTRSLVEKVEEFLGK